MSLMDQILKICMPPPEVDGKALEIKSNEMKGEELHQTYSDGTVGVITMKDDEKEPENFVVVTRITKDGDKTRTETLKKSKDGFKMKANIFNCFDEKIASAKESGGKYSGKFATTQQKGAEVTRYTRQHDEGKECWTKEKVENVGQDDEKCTELAKEEHAADKFKSNQELVDALAKFTGLDPKA